MRVLLTGASGFVGRAALAALLRRDVETFAVSRTRPALSGDFEWRSTNLLDSAQIARTIEVTRPDVILHLAWTVEHGRFWTDPANLDWIAATLGMARASATAGTRRFVGIGTCYEYDWPLDSDCREAETPLRPSLLYGTAKDATRRVLEVFGAANDLEVAWGRLFFLYGPGEGRDRLVPSVARALSSQRVAKCSSGTSVRDFLDVRDAGEALVALALSKVTGPVNIASGDATRIAEIAGTLGRLAGRPELVHIGALADRPGEPLRIVADVTRLRSEVGFSPRRTLDQGLGDALTYWTGAERGG